MSWTNRQLVEKAFEEIGYASYSMDLQPEQLQSALSRLDSMLMTWNAKNIRLGYSHGSSLDDSSNVPDAAIEAIYTNLAIRIAPIVGKTVSAETKTAAREAYRGLMAFTAVIPEKQLPAMPSGAGNKPWRNDNQFLNEPTDSVNSGV